MIRIRHVLVAGLAMAPAFAWAQAQDQGPKPVDIAKPAGAEAANISTVGDWFKFNTRVTGFKESGDTAAKAVTAGKSSCFRVAGEFLDPNDPKKQILRGTFEIGHAPHAGVWPPYGCDDPKVDGGDPKVNVDVSYDVSKDLIMNGVDRTRYGWTYGILVAPIKYYVKPREFSAGASVGPYLGYRVYERNGASNVIAISVGAATATVKTVDASGNSSSSNTTGLSVAVAYLANIKETFNIGVLAGTDLFSKSQNIETSNKLWLGVSFGYNIQ
jgi:hypothetical protein